ncbi:MAG: YHS domain-containing protein [Chloroflexota bacterium]
MAKDPVCGMDVNEKEAEKAGLTSQQQGRTYYFCSRGCKQDFESNPQRYMAQQPG